MSHSNRTKFTVCPNCQHQFEDKTDNYCPSCGQENHDFNLPASHLFLELLENTLHFDTKFFRTLSNLLFKPGKLTEAFILNKRASYVPPFRLYVFISFFFFLLLASDSINSREQSVAEKRENRTYSLNKKEPQNAKKVPGQVKQSLFYGLIQFDADTVAFRKIAKLQNPAALDSVLTRINFKPTGLNRYILKKSAIFLVANATEKNHKIAKSFSLMMFLLMPVFALLLALFYRRLHRNYIEHLIFSIHFHCFAFVLFSFNILINYFFETDWVSAAGFFILLIYFFLALRTVFKQGKGKTLVKTIFLLLVYLFILGFFMMLSLLLSATVI